MKNKLKIMLTGGHAATTGIAVVEEIRKSERLKNAEIYWIGSQTAIEGSNVFTIEYRIFPKIGVNFIPLNAGKIQTKFTRYTIPSLLKIPIGFFQAFYHLIKINPNVILSFGGYSSFPVVFWGWVFRIPVILHEQTVVAGRASIFSSFFATKIALSRKGSLKYFPEKKSVITGNPIMSNILSIKTKTMYGNPPVILVIGGSRGSNFINELVIDLAKSILTRFVIIHVTGERDFKSIEMFREKLPTNLQKNYKVHKSIEPLDMGSYYFQADIIISRSGANSVSEILYARRPAILIPLPRTFLGEQVKNAEYAETFGFSSVFLEKEATQSVIFKEINRLVNSWATIVKKSKENISPDKDASRKVVDLIEKYLK